MTKKLYYDCPVKALYMMKEFGVKCFTSCNKNIHKADDILYNYFDELHHDEKEVYHVQNNIKIYIHPDSLDIFEPRDGDFIMNDIPTKRNYTQGIPDIIVFDNKYHTYKVEGNDPYVVTGGGTWLELLQILTRSNKQFFMPEIEND